MALIVRAVDGDTVEARWGGAVGAVRLIGVDTPETVHPSMPVECYGDAAAEFTRRELEGRRVRLEFDVEKTDAYGRTLAYVWRAGRLFNRLLVARGFAQVSTYPPNVKYVERLLGAQRRAREGDLGLWGSCGSGRGKSQGAKSNAAGGHRRRRCDPGYRGTCVPPYPPDLDCGDVRERNFRSVGSDPHGFDGDRDGVACET